MDGRKHSGDGVNKTGKTGGWCLGALSDLSGAASQIDRDSATCDLRSRRLFTQVPMSTQNSDQTYPMKSVCLFHFCSIFSNIGGSALSRNEMRDRVPPQNPPFTFSHRRRFVASAPDEVYVVLPIFNPLRVRRTYAMYFDVPFAHLLAHQQCF